MMAYPSARTRRDPMKIRLHSGFTPLRFGAMLLAVLMATVSLVGCTPEQVMQAAGHLGVDITAEQAAAVADAHTAKHGPTDPTIEVTPEMAKAIAWTAAVHAAEQQTPGNRIRARWAGTGQEETAVRVAACESGGGKESGINPDAQNPGSTAYGSFQFLFRTWIGTGIAKTRDLGLQIEAAYRLWKARGWSPWNASRHCWAR